MDTLYISPNWFVTYSIGLELIFAIVTLLVAIYSFKIYQICKQREHKLFGLGFLSISLSYFAWLILNLSALVEISETLKALEFEFSTASLLIFLGAYMHIIFFLIGLLLLVYTTLRVESSKTFTLVAAISLALLIAMTNKGLVFYIISSILVFYMIIHYYQEYLAKNKKSLLVMLIAFVFLLLGIIDFVSISSAGHNYHYVLGHIFTFIAYILILTNLIKVLNNGKKKK